MMPFAENFSPERLPSWQHSAWQNFATRRLSGQMPHALMLTASPGLGLNDFAEMARTSLLCVNPRSDARACGVCRSCVARLAGSHPDDCAIRPEEGKVSIGIDAIRVAAERLSKTPQAGGFQVALIEPAHAMTIAAANALLKTLEEPSRDTVLILVSEQPGKLLPTILSRCQRLHLSRPSKADALTWLKANTKATAAQATNMEIALAIAGDAPLLAAQLFAGGVAQNYQTLCAVIDAGVLAGRMDSLAIGKQWQQKLAEFARLYEFYLLTQQRLACASVDATPARRALKVMRLSAQYQKLARTREWAGTGVRIDLSIAALLDQHVAAL